MRLLFYFSTLVAAALSVVLSSVASAQDLRVYCPMSEADCSMVLKRFEEDSGIKSSFTRIGTGEIVARIRAEKNNPQADLWLAGAAESFVQAAGEGLLVAHQAVGIEKVDERWRDKNHFWTPISQSPLVIVYSDSVLSETGAPPPSSWQSLADPVYGQGGLAVAHPASSGAAYATLATLVQIYGEDETFDLMKKIDANVVQYTRSGVAPIRMVASNEVAVGMGFFHDLEATLAQGYAASYVFPPEGVGFDLSAAAIIAGVSPAQHQSAAAFLDWILTDKGQEVMGSTFRLPVVSGIARNADAKVDVSTAHVIDYDFVLVGEERARLLERYEREVRQRADAK